MENYKKYLLYFCWIIGFFVLNFFTGRIEEIIEDYIKYKMSYYPLGRWGIVSLYIILGIFIGLIFLKSWKVKINKPFLLIVVIPLFIVLIYQMYKFSLFLRLDLKVLALACGVTLLHGLFGRSNERRIYDNI